MDDPSLSPDAVIALAAALLDLGLPDPCLAGVAENLAALAAHARTLDDPA
jgi:hypothetical protein